MSSGEATLLASSLNAGEETKSRIPFLRTNLPRIEKYLPYLREIDENRWYSNFGPLVSRFEDQLLAKFFANAGSVTTVANCTLGLMLALKATCRPNSKYVIVPSFTFAATPLAVISAGFEPYFIDVNPDDWTSSTRHIEEAIAALGNGVAAVMPYATFGTALELSYYNDLETRGIPVIVDAAPGLGTTNPDSTPFAKNFAGSVVFSMHATKPFGIGEGGLVYSGDAGKIQAIRQLSNFGFASPGVTEMEGTNAKLPEISAAVGLAVMETYSEKIARLEALFRAYVTAIDRSDVLNPNSNTQAIRGNVPHQFMPIILPVDVDTSRLADEISKLGIGTRRYFNPPCHQQSVFKNFAHGSLQTTEAVVNRILCLPLWDGMNSDVPELIVDRLTALIKLVPGK